MLERSLVKRIKAYLDSKGVLCWKNHGSAYMPAGMPDIIGVIGSGHFRGMMIAIECKVPGNRPSESQKLFIENLLNHGAFACWCDSFENAKKFIDMFC